MELPFRISMYKVGLVISMSSGLGSYPIGVPPKEYPCLPGKVPMSIEDVTFDHITGSKIGYYKGEGTKGVVEEMHMTDAIVLSGHPEASLKRFTLSNTNIKFKGGGTMEDSKKRLPDINQVYKQVYVLHRLWNYCQKCRAMQCLPLMRLLFEVYKRYIPKFLNPTTF